MSKIEFKCFLIQKFLEVNGEYPNTQEREEIQKLADFAFNGE